MLKVGGIWVSPIEIENVLMAHEAVNEAAVVGHEVEGLVKPFVYVTLNEGFKRREDWDTGEELLHFVSERLPKFEIITCHPLCRGAAEDHDRKNTEIQAEGIAERPRSTSMPQNFFSFVVHFNSSLS